MSASRIGLVRMYVDVFEVLVMFSAVVSGRDDAALSNLILTVDPVMDITATV